MMAGPEDVDNRHPRLTDHLIGHEAAWDTLRRADAGRRLPHAWLISGPRGIGKATLAYHFAGHLLAEADPQASRLIAQDSHPGLVAIERGWDEKNKRMRRDILVDDIRQLHGFFGMTASGGGWRVAIIDAADDMNRQAANAVLKILEEPPAKSVIILIAHAPGQLLPTLRSRCQHLPLRPLSNEDLLAVLGAQGVSIPTADANIVAGLAAGSPGRALELIENGGAALYRDVTALLNALPQVDPRALHGLGDSVTGKGGTDRFRLLGEVLDDVLKRLIAFGATDSEKTGIDESETRLFAHLAPRANLEQWIEVWENTADLFRRAEGINLDPKQVTLNVFTRLETLTAQR